MTGVTLHLTGDSTDLVISDASGNYSFTVLIPGSYVVTPSKSPLPPTGQGITIADALAVTRHYLGITPLPAGCRLSAGDVNNDSVINTQDAIAIQRFYIGLTVGTANVGKYAFVPASRSYSQMAGPETGQDFDAFVYGDVNTPFVNRPGDPSPDSASDSTASDIPLFITLPESPSAPSRANGVSAVSVSAIDPKMKLVGFQGDFTFDERVINFQGDPVRKAGLTAGNWSVTGNVLDGVGPIRTLRISAYSTDFKPLAGSGTLFELRMKEAKGRRGTPLNWCAPPNDFIFIDAELNAQKPRNAPRTNDPNSTNRR